MYKIMMQSSTPVTGLPAYLQGIKEHAQKILPSDYTVDIRGVPEGSTPDVHFLAYEFWNNRVILNNIIQAEKEGYDAVATHCFLDPVLQEARELVDIPVVSLGESSMLFSLMYGRRFSVVTYTPQLACKAYPDLITKYRLDDRAAPVQSFELSLTELVDAFSDPVPVIEQFLDACEAAIQKGAEVILPGCGCLNIICVQNGISSVRNTGVPIIDVTGVVLKMAETAIILKKVSGTSVSRYGYYEQPNDIKQIKRFYDSITLANV